MEYLVTMTTRVPAGTPEAAVDDIRAREARRSAELARAGQLLRLWRPPLLSGEWRTLGLFSAPDDGSLEQTLASMPLRIWRSDETLPLSVHPNDPASAGAVPVGLAGSEFLITMTVSPPPGTPPWQVDDALSREAQRARELAAQGRLLRLWSIQEFQSRLLRVAGLALDGGSLRGLFWVESTVFRLRSAPEAHRIPDMENHVVLVVGLGKDAVETGQRSARDAGQSLRSRR